MDSIKNRPIASSTRIITIAAILLIGTPIMRLVPPTISANGRVLAFQRMTGNDVCSLFVQELASGNERAITTSKKTSFNAALSLKP